MGMDVYGLAPTSDKGKYFRASIWTWPAIHSLTAQTCRDLIDPETLRLMAYNDGEGVRDAKTCQLMSHRIAAWMEQHTEGHGVEPTEDDLGNKLVGPLAKMGISAEVPTRREVDDRHLQQWVDFLYDCGGFEVW